MRVLPLTVALIVLVLAVLGLVFVLDDGPTNEAGLIESDRESSLGLDELGAPGAGEGLFDGSGDSEVRRGAGAELGGEELEPTREGRSSSGRVVRDRDGSPVPDLALRLTQRNPLRSRMQGWNLQSDLLSRFSPGLGEALAQDDPALGSIAQAKTDTSGRFQVAGTNEGWYVSIDDPFYYLSRPAERIFGRREEVLQVARGGRITGRVGLPQQPVEPALALLRTAEGGGGFGRGGRGRSFFRGGFDPSQAMRGELIEKDGTFAFDGLPADDDTSYQVWIVAPGVATFASDPLDVRPGLEQRVEMSLESGLNVGGLVRNREGGPVANAIVRLAYEGAASEEQTQTENGRGDRGGRGGRGGRGNPGDFMSRLASTSTFLEVKTDVNGVFTWEGLGDGSYRYEVEAIGYVPAENRRFQILYGNHDEILVELDEARILTGVVLSPTGQPVAGALVSAEELLMPDENGGFGDLSAFGFGRGGGRGGDRGGMRELFRGGDRGASPETVSDARGRFLLPDVPARWKEVLLSGVTDNGLRGSMQVPRKWNLDAGPLELKMSATGAVLVQLVYPEGAEPSEQVTLGLLQGETPFPSRSERFTWPGPELALLDVEPGEYKLNVQAKGFAPQQIELVVEELGTPVEVPVELSPGAEIRGLASETVSGRPIGGAEITVRFDFRSMRDGGAANGGAANSGARNIQVTAKTDETGRFVLVDLAEGTLSLRGEHPDYPEGRGEEIVLEEGQIIRDYQVDFVPGASITGTVVDSEGLPREGWSVSASRQTQDQNGGRGGWGGGRPTRTDEFGRYEIERLEPGEYRVSLSKGGGGRGGRGGSSSLAINKTVEVFPAQVLVVDFDGSDLATATLIGTLTDAGSPVRGGRASLAPAGGASPISANIAENGEFTFADLPLGSYRVTFQPPRAEGEERSRARSSGGGAGIAVLIEDAGELRREFQLPSGRIAGSVRTSGELRGTSVTLNVVEETGSTREVSRASVDRESGAYVFEYLDAGLYRVVAQPPRARGGRGGGQSGATEASAPLAPASIEIGLGENEKREGVMLTLTAGGTLEFRVVDDADEAVRSATVTLTGSDPQTRGIRSSARSDGEGQGTLTGLAPGVYDVRVSARNYATTSGGEVVVGAGSTVQREFRVVKGVAFSVEITDSGGEPVTDARIEIRNGNDDLVGTFPTQGGRGGRGGRGGGTGGGQQLDGVYNLGSYALGSYRLVVTHGASEKPETFSLRHTEGVRGRLTVSKD